MRKQLIEVIQQKRGVWLWAYYNANGNAKHGICRTKGDALNDSSISAGLTVSQLTPRKCTRGKYVFSTAQPERGAAAISVELSRGKVVVRHSDGAVLLRRTVALGFWDSLWTTLRNAP